MDSVTSNGHPALRRVAIVLFMGALTPCILAINVALVTVIITLFLIYVGARIVIRGILLPFVRWTGSVWTRIRTIPEFRAGFRNGIAVAILAAVLVVVVGGGLGPAVSGMGAWISSLFQDSTSESSLSRAAIHGDIVNGCSANCQRDIHAERVKIVGIEENEVAYVRAALRREYANPAYPVWQTTRVQTCVANYAMFQKAQEYTMYPASLLAGKAYVEGMGCQFINATNGDGGKGPMQITYYTADNEKAVAKMLHESSSWVHAHWRGQDRSSDQQRSWNYWTNVLMGAVILSNFETEFMSRGVGILAYNAGPGNVRKYMRTAGIREYGNHQISQFRGAIPAETSTKAKPQIYLDRILAGAVMVDRARRGLPVTDGDWIDELTLADIPGADPRNDSVR